MISTTLYKYLVNTEDSAYKSSSILKSTYYVISGLFTMVVSRWSDLYLNIPNIICELAYYENNFVHGKKYNWNWDNLLFQITYWSNGKQSDKCIKLNSDGRATIEDTDDNRYV